MRSQYYCNMTEHTEQEYAIETRDLSYKFTLNNKVGLSHVSLKIPWGKCNLLIGPNGAGKSTLLRILAGKTLIKQGQLRIAGFDPFEFTSDRNDRHNSDMNQWITYLGTEWAGNPSVKRDIPVRLLISSIGGEVYSDRRDELIELLDIDPDWSMAYISDGERRRVQLVMGLLKPWRLLLLDEVTVDLDVLVRKLLLNFLRRECVERKCCIIYATHIFDGFSTDWCDRILHLRSGELVSDISSDEINFTPNGSQVKQKDDGVEIPMVKSFHPLALSWIQEDLHIRGTREDEKEKQSKRSLNWDNDGKYFDGDELRFNSYFKATRGIV